MGAGDRRQLVLPFLQKVHQHPANSGPEFKPPVGFSVLAADSVLIKNDDEGAETMSGDLVVIKSKDFDPFVMNKNNCHLFWYWVWKRQEIYHNRFVLGKDPPWTDDKILSEYRFTNVYRELDRTTIWYHDNIGGHFYKTGEVEFPNGLTEKDVVFITFIHRLFNRIETMQVLLPYLPLKEFNHKHVTKLLIGLRSGAITGQPQVVWTSAHLTTGVRFGGYDDKLLNIMHLVKLIHEEIDSIYGSIKGSYNLEDLYNRTRKVNGFGPFLGYQYILDMINSGVRSFSTDDFVVAGPGCKRGIRLIFPDSDRYNISFENAMLYMRKRQHKYFEKYNFDFKFVDDLGGREKGIHLGNIENCMCEFSKFHKAYHNYGRPRNKFVPHKGD